MYRLLKVVLFPLLCIELVFLIFYKLCISPIIDSNCPKLPTCSVYMMRSLIRFDAISGLVIGSRRLLQCTSKHNGGLDLEPLNLLGEYKWVC